MTYFTSEHCILIYANVCTQKGNYCTCILLKYIALILCVTFASAVELYAFLFLLRPAVKTDNIITKCSILFFSYWQLDRCHPARILLCHNLKLLATVTRHCQFQYSLNARRISEKFDGFGGRTFLITTVQVG